MRRRNTIWLSATPIYTAWGSDGVAHTLIEGDTPPRFGDGLIQPDCSELIWRIIADSWDDACRKYHELQNWEPYKPLVQPQSL